jgi:branched-subunit amino acid transport protein
MNPEKRLEILEAFISTKPREFDAFMQDYLEHYPEPVVAAIMAPTVVFDSVEEKPTRKRKPKIEE